jgi:hypothetical protein
VASIETLVRLRSGDIVLDVGRTASAEPLQMGAAAGGSGTALCTGNLLMHLAGRTPQQFGWDEAGLATSGSLEARVQRGGFEIATTATPAPDAQGFDIETVLTARAEVRLVALWHRFAFPPGADRELGRPLDFAWIPNLCWGRDDIAGEHVFRSPCLIARQGRAQMALVPHLRPSLFTGQLRHALRFRLEEERCPTLDFGRLDQRPYHHVYFRPTGRAVALKPGDKLHLAFTLLADTAAGEFGYRAALRFIGKRWAEPAFTGTLLPQVLPFDEYAREGFASTLERYGMWRGFTIDGKRAGGTCAMVMRHGLDTGSPVLPRDTTLKVFVSYLLSPTMNLHDKARLVPPLLRGIHPHVWYSLFMNNLRTAFGMEWYARRWKDEGLAEKARMMRELALMAPTPHGILPSVFTADADRPRWVPGAKVWRYTSAYHTANAAWTGCWMLNHFRHLEADERLLVRCRALGDFFVRVQLPSGAIPTFVRIRRDGSPEPVPPLPESASSAGPGLFLAMLHGSSKDPRHLEAAKRVAGFLVDRVFPRSAWQDSELFFSCSEKRLGWRDARTGILPQSTFPLAWTAELMRLLYLATRSIRYLEQGKAALDLLLLYQQVWDAPFLDLTTTGGFGVMNTDAEWNDAREAQFGTLLMDWYDTTGEPELFHRGVAALRSSFALMHLEEHRVIAPGNNPTIGPEDRGAMPENYGHAGFDVKIQGNRLPDWGAGSAASSAALAQAQWGDLYLDVRRGQAFGIDGCRVKRAVLGTDRADLDLEMLGWGACRLPLIVKASGITAPRYALRINGHDLGTLDRADLERGIPGIPMEVT